MTTTMTAPPSSEAPSSDVASGRLRQLAADERFETRNRELNDLADAVESADGDLQGWDSVDLFDAFTPESTIEIRPARHTTLEWSVSALAAVAVFLPVAWTWWSMSEAAGAYQSVIDRGLGDGLSFLQLWVDGFSLLGPGKEVHSLGTTAWVSVLLIMIAVAVVVLQRLVTNRKNLLEEREYRAAEARLNEVLTLTTRTISVRSIADANTLESMVKRSVRALNKVHAATANSAAELQAAVEQATLTLNESLAQVGPLLADVKSTTGTMASTAQTMGDSASNAGAATQAAVATLATEVTRSSAEWRTSHLAAVDASSQAMTSAADSLRRSAEALATSSQELARSMNELNTTGQQVPTMLSTAMQASLANTVSHVSKVVPEFDRATTEMTAALRTIDSALVGNQSATQAQVTELSQARDALGQILVQLQALADTATKQSAA